MLVEENQKSQFRVR